MEIKKKRQLYFMLPNMKSEFSLCGILRSRALGRLTCQLCASQQRTPGHLSAAESVPFRVQLHVCAPANFRNGYREPRAPWTLLLLLSRDECI
jgi:hypothetical protein